MTEITESILEALKPMAPPTSDLMMRPVLELASRQDITRRSAEQAMREYFHLTDEDMALRIPSGQDGLVRIG